MADETEILQGLAESARSGADFIFWAIFSVLILVVVIFLIWYWRFTRSFKHTIVLRERTKGATDLVVIDRYRYTGGRGETETIQLWSTKELKPCPPEKAKDFKRNGTEYVEGWISETGEIKFINSELVKLEQPKFKEVIKWYDGNFLFKFVNWIRTSRIIKAPPLRPAFIKYLEQSEKPKGEIEFTGLQTKDKEFYANQHFKSLRYKKKDLLTWISENAGLIVLIFIVVLVFAFWKEITDPLLTVAVKLSEISDKQSRLMDRVEALVNQRQIIEAEKAGLTNGTGPPD